MSGNLSVELYSISSESLTCDVHVEKAHRLSLSKGMKSNLQIPERGQISFEIKEKSASVSVLEISMIPFNELVLIPLLPEVFIKLQKSGSTGSVWVGKDNAIMNDLKKHTKSLKKQLTIERARRQQQDAKIISLAHDYQDAIKRLHSKEEDLLQQLALKEKQCLELTNSNSLLNMQLRQCQSQISANDSLSNASETIDETFKHLTDQISVLKNALRDSEDSRNELRILLSNAGQSFSQKRYEKLENENEILSLEVSSLKEMVKEKESILKKVTGISSEFANSGALAESEIQLQGK